MMMTETQAALYRQLCDFDIDGGPSALTFAKRLARENGWSLRFAERAIAEYRKFVFLAMEAGHKVTPSDEVDQVWHLHMIYTESYWTRMTQEILPRPLHHGPTRGGQAEDAKYEDLYGRTMESYRRFFGEPPADLWPASDQRFGARFMRVDAARNWVIPKPAKQRVALVAGGLLASLVAAGCATIQPVGWGFDVGNLILWLILLVGGGIIAALLIAASNRASRKGDSGGCSTATMSSGCGSTDRRADSDARDGDGSGCSSDSGGSDGGSSGCSGGGCGGGGCSS